VTHTTDDEAPEPRAASESESEHADGAAPAPEAPAAPARRWLQVALAVRDDIKVHDVPSLAAGVAFKIFLALFPSLLAFLAVVSLVADPEVLVDALDEVVPPAVLDLVAPRIEGVTGTGGAGALLTVGVLGGLWAASSAAVTLIKAMTRIHGAVEGRGFVGQRLTALLLIASLLLALAVIVVLVVFGPQVRAAVLGVVDLGGIGAVLFNLAQAAVAVLVLVLLLSFAYWAAPDVADLPRRWISPGAVLGAIGWLVLSAGFSLYTQTAGNYEATYAGLAGVIVTLVWLQLSMLVLLLGAQLDATLQARREGSSHGSAELLLGTSAEQQGERAEQGDERGQAARAQRIGAAAAPAAAAAAAPEPGASREPGGGPEPSRGADAGPPQPARLPAALAGLGALAAAAVIGLRLRR